MLSNKIKLQTRAEYSLGQRAPGKDERFVGRQFREALAASGFTYQSKAYARFRKQVLESDDVVKLCCAIVKFFNAENAVVAAAANSAQAAKVHQLLSGQLKLTAGEQFKEVEEDTAGPASNHGAALAAGQAGAAAVLSAKGTTRSTRSSTRDSRAEVPAPGTASAKDADLAARVEARLGPKRAVEQLRQTSAAALGDNQALPERAEPPSKAARVESRGESGSSHA